MRRIIKNEWLWLGLIILAGIFLRFWKIVEWQHLTYDQSRDYIILKRILIDHKLTLVGPTVSIAPGFFLPPFYYYSLLPFIYLFNFHIVGPDVYTAILGVFSIIIFYFLSRDFFGIFPSLIATFVYGINPYLVQTSRHAWNSNTLFLYSGLFFLSFEKYIFKKKRKWLLVAGLSLGWAIGLHLTAIVFLPLFLYLLYREIKDRRIGIPTFNGIFLFLLVFLPLFFFDLRHGFPVTKAGISYLQKQNANTERDDFLERFKQTGVDLYKMPVVLLSGMFQKENMTVRPSNITSFSQVNYSQTKTMLEKTIFFSTLFLWVVSFFSVFRAWKTNAKILLIFLFSGLFIRLCFPAKLFYFYYYLSVFPLVYLFLACFINTFNDTKGKIAAGTVILALSLVSWRTGFYKDPKTEGYFLPASKIIAGDIVARNKIVIAGNVADKSRWEHNGLEYRYFLEAIYKIPLLGVEASDYKTADVLYFIDEGEVKDPLKFGGMEVEAFKPAKIEKKWKIETGQKIYKMTH